MTFALITEGVSEYNIIKNIVAKYFKDQDPSFTPVQPKIISDKQENNGGWNEVLKYCERDELSDILTENDYLIIQIDTDLSQTAPFNISHTKIDAETGNNSNKTAEELHKDVQEKLLSLIKPEILNTKGNRIIFAICIHTIECWLLPIYYTNNHRSDVTTCIQTLNNQLRRENIKTLPITGKNSPQSILVYQTILGSWKKKKNILDSAQYNHGFTSFIESLEKIEVN